MSTSFTMIGGEGPNSYREHSKYQGALVIAAKEKINEAISTKLDIDFTSNLVNIADFGCSSGPNTFTAVQTLIDAVENKYKKESNIEGIEFQVFFNDSSNNDFNTLFKTLPPARLYFASGVPGSFFGRVLPKIVFMWEFLLTHSISYPRFPKKSKTVTRLCGTKTYIAPDLQKKL